MKPFALVALVAFVVAGCGGASSASSLYTLAATKQCLQTTAGIHNFAAVSTDDFVASTASNGGLRVTLPDSNAVTTLFGQSAQEASNLADAYRRFHAKNVGIEDVLRTDNNVVLLWQLHPSSADENTIHDCLK
ncbi:MAG TPA: hypothetical protein VH210_01315 [Gaiellaceae bacterium]|nr:hypothetical protein [Gaiellaceae bacterium]